MHGLHQVNSDTRLLSQAYSQNDPDTMLLDEFLLAGLKIQTCRAKNYSSTSHNPKTVLLITITITTSTSQLNEHDVYGSKICDSIKRATLAVFPCPHSHPKTPS
jgi:hypothetical protein